MSAKIAVLVFLVGVSGGLWSAEGSVKKPSNSHNCTNEECSDTLFFLNGDELPVTYLKQTDTRVYFETCGRYKSRRTFNKNDLQKIRYADGSEEIFNQRASAKKSRSNLRTGIIILTVVIAVPLLAFGLLILGYAIFSPW